MEIPIGHWLTETTGLLKRPSLLNRQGDAGYSGARGGNRHLEFGDYGSLRQVRTATTISEIRSLEFH